jgi:hypothetical protein
MTEEYKNKKKQKVQCLTKITSIRKKKEKVYISIDVRKEGRKERKKERKKERNKEEE